MFVVGDPIQVRHNENSEPFCTKRSEPDKSEDEINSIWHFRAGFFRNLASACGKAARVAPIREILRV